MKTLSEIIYERLSNMLGEKSSVSLMYKTYIRRINEKKINCTLWETDIIISEPDVCILNTGGWKTKLTKERINFLTPLSIYSEKGLWVFGWQDKKYYYVQNQIVIIRNNIEKQSPETTVLLLKNLKKYVANTVDVLYKGEGKLKDMDGDCWYCKFMETTKECMLKHIKENYLMGSVITNAILNNDTVGDYIKSIVFNLLTGKEVRRADIYRSEITRIITKYIKKVVEV